MCKLVNGLKKFLFEYWFIIIFTIIFALIFYYNGMFGVSSHQDGDNFVFRNSAYFMKRGLFMYKDFMDNKGPYLYFINYILFLFDDIHLIFYFTLVLGIITNIYIYKIAKLKLNSFYSNLVVILCNGLFLVYTKKFAGGITNNMVEFYAMPVFAYTYYKYLEHKKLSRFSIVMLGALCGFLLNLRVNLASISVICSFFILLDYFNNKNYKDIFTYIVFYLIGILISFIPIIIYFNYAGSFNYYIDSYILFNSKYSMRVMDNNSESGNALLTHLFTGLIITIDFSLNIYSILAIIVYLINIIKYKKDIENFIIYIFCLLMATMISARYYFHYVWIMVPLISYPLSLLFEYIDLKKITKIMCYLTIVISIFVYSINIFKAIKLKFEDDNEEYYSMIEYIQNNFKNENDKIFFMCPIVNDCYIDSNMLPAGDYIFQYKFTTNLYYNTMEVFRNNRPNYVVSSPYRLLQDFVYFMQDELSNNYNKIYENELYEIYELK